MIEITEAMVKAGAAAICCQAHKLGCAAQAKDSEFTVCQLATYLKDAQNCLEIALAVAKEEKRKNCKHTNKFGVGSLGSDGSSSTNWHCRDCGKSYSETTPSIPRPKRQP